MAVKTIVIQCICCGHAPLWSQTGAGPGFQVRGGGAHLKKLHRAEGGAKFWGYFVWKITILRQKIIFFPIAEGGAKIFGIFRVKNHDFTPKNHNFSKFRGGARPLDPPLRRVPLMEYELLTLPEHKSSPPVFSGVRVTRSLVLCVRFIDRCLSFWPLCCLFFFDIRILITLWYIRTLLTTQILKANNSI